MKTIKKRWAALLLLPALALGGCSAIPSYSSDYGNARQQVVGVTLDQQKADEIGQRFTQAFNRLGSEQFLIDAKALYAEQLFINDTLSQYAQRADLVEHFRGLNARLSNVDVRLLNTSYYNDSAYVHWRMAYDLRMFGTTRTMASYGISEMKINADGKIIFQQDFWDPADGLYRSLPYFGGIYSWVLPFKKQP